MADYQELAKGQMLGGADGFLKLIFHTETLKLLGVHCIGDGATEIIHIGQARVFVRVWMFALTALFQAGRWKDVSLGWPNDRRTLSGQDSTPRGFVDCVEWDNPHSAAPKQLPLYRGATCFRARGGTAGTASLSSIPSIFSPRNIPSLPLTSPLRLLPPGFCGGSFSSGST